MINRRLYISLISVLFTIILSCNIEKQSREIDINKSEKIIEYFSKYSINKLFLYQEHLIINDTLIKFNNSTNDSVQSLLWTTFQMDLNEWVSVKNINQEDIVNLKRLMIESNNLKIIKDQDAYFFSEGGWIDSEWGKVFSLKNILDQEDIFKFERVQDIEVIEGKLNWYEYYAD